MSDSTERIRNLSPAQRELLMQSVASPGQSAAASIPPREDGDSYPLSFAQRRLWFLDRLRGAAAGYEMPIALELRGPLDVEALGQALNAVVDRHDVLRSTFTSVGGRPVQRRSAPADRPLRAVDLRSLPEAARRDELHRQIARIQGHRFSLEAGPLVDFSLLRLEDDCHVLLIVMHHIVADGWSLGILFRDMAAFYTAFRSRAVPSLPSLPISYADFAHWEQQRWNGGSLRDQVRYWEQQLRGVAPLSVPSDRPPPSSPTGRGATRVLSLADSLRGQLDALCRQQGVTLFMALLAALDVLLAQRAGRRDVAVGAPVANRPHPDVEALIGCFVNAVVLRTRFDDDPTFIELLARVRETCLEAYAHQDVPIDKLVERVAPQRGAGGTPWIRVMFALQNAPLAHLDMPGLSAAALEVEATTARFDLEFNVWETAAGLDVRLTYDTDLYESASVSRLLEGYHDVLESAVRRPAARVSELPSLSTLERQRTLVEWNDTRTAFPRDVALSTLFENQVERAADRVALVFGQQRWTFSQLNARADVVARRLASLGVGPDTPVAIRARRSMDLVAALVGILKAGGAYVPLDPEAPPSRVGLILEDIGAPVVLADSESIGLVNESLQTLTHRPRVVDLRLIEHDPACHAVPLAGRTCRGDNLACVMYTSGSTGRPKGISVVHRAIARLILGQTFFESSDQVFLHAAPLAFDASTFEIWGSLLNGATLALAPPGPLSLADLEQTLTQHRVTTAWLSAGLFRIAVSQRPEIFGRLRQLLAGGDVVSPDAVREFLRVNPAAVFINGYGPTENTTFTCCHRQRFADPLGARVPIGRPINNTQVYVLDDDLNPLPIGVPGELCIGGDGLSRGYWKNPSLTAQQFVPHPFSDALGARMYRSGDRVQWNADGTLDFLGRRDRQIKIRGFRVEPGEIESALRQFEGVEDAVVQDRAEAGGEKQLVAWLQYRGQTPPTHGRLRQALLARLPSHMVPSEFLFVDRLPRTAAGKVNRAALSVAPAARDRADAPDASAGDSLLEQVAAQWREVLGREQIGLDDNFFDVGGHSLLLVELHHRLQTRLAPTMSIVELFRNPTIRTQAERISAALAPAASAPAETVDAAPSCAVPGPSMKGDRAPRQAVDAVAVVGMSGRFPKAASIDEFWRNLAAGAECVTWFQDDELDRAGVPRELLRNSRYVKAKAVCQDAEWFDAEFFGYHPREAELIDPQQRLLLECAWEALEEAGYVPDLVPSAAGVFCGVGSNSYLQRLLADPQIAATVGDLQLTIANDKDYAAPRIAYKLNLTGPVISIQTACSTSLVAVVQACQSLVGRQCDLALAGGACVTLPRQSGYLYQEGSVLSPDGHCRALDAQAQGTIPGEGAAIVVLKRLADALADRDHIHAILRGWATNNDGALRVGFTAPGVRGQAEVIAAAYRMAGVDPRTVSYVEAHGTGTDLGDAVELEALREAFDASARGQGICYLGSVKSNIGHLDAAAGVASLIKTILALRHRQIPASLHFRTPNPRMALPGSRFRVAARLTEWTECSLPRRAGVSSFGIGGSNAHVVVEEPPAPPSGGAERPCQLLVLSARSNDSLEQACRRLADHLRRQPAVQLADVAFTLQCGRKRHAHRRAVVCRSREEAIGLLEQPLPSSDATQSLAADDPSADTANDILASLSRPQDNQHDLAVLLDSLGRAWVRGARVDWRAFWIGWERSRVSLPTYPFERRRYYVELPAEPARAPLRKSSDVADWGYVPGWKTVTWPSDRSAVAEPDSEAQWLIFGDDVGLGSQLAAHLRQRGAVATLVRPGDEFRQLADFEYSLDPRQSDGYGTLLRAMPPPALRIVHAWSLTPRPVNEPEIDPAQQRGIYSLLKLVQAIGQQAPFGSVRIDVVSNHLHDVHGGEPLSPAKATILAGCKVIGQEYPHITCRNIDLDIDASRGHRGTVLRELLLELGRDSREPIVAHRGGRRWAPTYDRLPLAAARPPALKHRGVYLITGGLGRMGLSIAADLAREVSARVVLIGRTAPASCSRRSQEPRAASPAGAPGEVARQVQRLEQLGGEVLTIPADVADLKQMTSAIEQARSHFGRIDGVIHAAGHSRSVAIEDLGPDQFAMYFRAKLEGVRVLERLLRESRLDFCALMSSLSSILGGLGLCGYAAANIFMDTFARLQNRTSNFPWITIQWDGWRFDGDEIQLETSIDSVASLALTAAQGTDVLRRVLSSGEQTVAISTGDLSVRLDQWITRAGWPGSTAPAVAASALHPRPKLATPYVAPRNELEKTVADVWGRMLGVDRIGIHDDFFELGGHSLLAARVISRLQEILQVNLGIRSIFETKTVAAFAAHVETALWALGGSAQGKDDRERRVDFEF